tara:strand:- start:2057 stop:2512 length:456 start_codon:yes stop_codon:yes gene_type:complete
MAFNLTATLNALLTHLAGAGHFEQVQIGEPKSPPSTTGLTGAIFIANLVTNDITFQLGIEVHTVTIRCYLNMMHEPHKDIELKLAGAISKIITDLLGDWNLSTAIKHIDSGAEFSSGIDVGFSYLDVGGTMFRVADITVPMVVDSAVALTA